MKCKTNFVLAVVAIAALVLSACATPAAPTVAPAAAVDTQVSVPTAPPVASPTAESAPAQPVQAAKPVRLQYWSFQSETEPLAIVRAASIKAWNEAHPEIQVEVTWVGRDVITKLRTALLSGEAPDIITQSDSELNPSVIAEGLALPLDDALSTPGFESDQPWKDAFAAGALLPSPDGKTYIIPEAFYTSGLFYNVALFKELGLEPPTTWGEMLDVCQKLKDAGKTPLALDGAYSFFGSWYFVWLASRTVGAEALRAAALDQTGATWDAPGFLEAARKEKLLVDRGYFQEGYEGTNWPGAETLFAQGSVGMYLTGTWFPAEISDKVGADWQMDLIPFPTIDGSTADQRTAEAWTNGAIILKDSKNPDAAIEFLKYMSSETQQSSFGEVWTPAANKDVPLPKYTSGQKTILDNASQIVPRLHGLQLDSPEWTKAVYWTVNDKLLFGELTPEQFIEELKSTQIQFYQRKS